jgi:hypothetical protein
MGLQSNSDTTYSSGDVNQMVILKNSKDLLESLYNQGPAPPAIALTNLTSQPPT